MNIFQKALRAVMSRGNNNPQPESPPAADTFFKYLSLNTTKLGIDPRGDRVGDNVTYQWHGHGPFSVARNPIDPIDTTVSIASSLEDEFKIQIYGEYQKYLAPWISKGLPVPSVSWLIRQTP